MSSESAPPTSTTTPTDTCASQSQTAPDDQISAFLRSDSTVWSDPSESLVQREMDWRRVVKAAWAKKGAPAPTSELSRGAADLLARLEAKKEGGAVGVMATAEKKAKMKKTVKGEATPPARLSEAAITSVLASKPKASGIKRNAAALQPHTSPANASTILSDDTIVPTVDPASCQAGYDAGWKVFLSAAAKKFAEINTQCGDWLEYMRKARDNGDMAELSRLLDEALAHDERDEDEVDWEGGGRVVD